MEAATWTLPSVVIILGILLARPDTLPDVMLPFLPDMLFTWPAVLLSAAALFLLILSASLSRFMDGVPVASLGSSLPLTRSSN